MLPLHMLPTWNELGVGLANHLWQSTVFAVSVGAVTLLFRRNRAVIRYRLWLIASVKFLLPFSLFVGLGSLLEWHPVRPVTPSEVPVVVRQISQPFTSSPVTIPAHSVAKAAPVASPSLGVAFASVWFGGAAVVFLVWCFRWLQIARIVRNADALDAIVKSPGIRILTSRARIEPGVFGIFRPVLLLPEGVARNLPAEQLEPIIAHEMIHVSGRDNLAAALHTIVEAMFWFHPLVWWLGNKLVEERERACDEAVLQMGYEPADYAEGILKFCKSNAMAPACMAGVSGSNLKKRIEVIMENRGTRNLTPGKKLLLSIAGAGVLIGPVFAGMMSAAESPIGAVPEMQLPFVESTTSAALPVLSQAPAPSSRQNPAPPAVRAEPQASAVRVEVLPVIENGTITMLPVISQLAVPSPQQAPAPPAVQVVNPLQKWLDDVSIIITDEERKAFQNVPARITQASVPVPPQSAAPPAVQGVAGQQKWLDDVSVIITDEERKAFPRLTKDEERENFIRNFWLVRDPTPGTSANEFRDEYNSRVAYANDHFTTRSGTPGSQTDRGKMHILRGPPDEIVSHPSGGTFYRPANQGGGTTAAFPFETWTYRHIPGNGNVVYEFVDKQMTGEYTLEYYDPAAKSK